MTKMTLLRSAALGAMLTLGLSAGAHAADADKAVAHHKKHHAVAHAAESQTGAEIAALKAEVAALEQRLDASNATAQQAQAAAQQAQASAQQAQAAAQNDQTAISQIPGAVDSAVSKLPKPKPGWEADTKVSGRVYYDVSNINQKSDGNKVAPTGTGFDIKRAYVSVDHKFNDVWSADITTDMQYSSAIGATELFVKKAYVQGAFSPMFTVRLGAADMPWIPFAEDVYGYRYVEQTITDRTKFGTSSDWGVHALGKLLDGHVGYQLSVVNGGGYKNPTARSQSVDFEGRVNVNYGPFVAAIGGYEGKLAKDTVGATTPHTASRLNALAAYVNPKFRLGVEYFSADDWNNVASATADKSSGWSGFGNYNFTPKVAVFGRYDWEKPNADTAASKKDNYFNFGLSYEPIKIVDFSLVYKRDKVDNGTIATGNGTIGGVKQGTYDEVGMFGQIRW